MIKKTVLFFILVLFCMPLYGEKLKVYPNPWIPESGKSLTGRNDEMKHGAYTADGWVKFEGVKASSGTLRIYDITGHLIRNKNWTMTEEQQIPLPETSAEVIMNPDGTIKDRKKEIVHWDGKNNDCEYVESGVYIWIITGTDGVNNNIKYDGKIVVIR